MGVWASSAAAIRWWRRRPPIVRAVRAAKLTYLDEAALVDLWQRVRAAEVRGIPGLLIEAGCARGGSAIVIASAKAKARRLLVHDVFGMIPPPTAADGADVHARYEVIRSGKAVGPQGERYYGYEPDLLDQVRAQFRAHGVPVEEHAVELVPGLFEDTLRGDEPVALAHLDGDWYQSVMTCLTRIVPRLVPGGVLVIDDYDAWSGCRKAVDEFFAGQRDRFRFVKRARLQIERR